MAVSMDLSLVIRGGTVLTPDGFRPDLDVGLAGERIAAVGPRLERATEELDARGLYVLPGLVDVHIHGAGGSEHPAEMARFLPGTGVTAFLPTLAASAPDDTLAFVASVADAEHAEGAEVLGSHLEGPFLAAERRGAQPPEHLRSPDLAEVDRILAAAGGTLQRVTLAPELPGAEAVVARLVQAGVQVSLGHSSCTYAEALQAAAWGATSVTHTYNAMAPFHHREPGLVGAALTCERLMAELIADGVHVHPAAARALIASRGPAGVAVVSDALPPLGLPPGEYDWLGRRIVTDGIVASLAGEAIAGSVTPMLQAVRNLVSWGVPLEHAASMASAVPARLAGAANRKGRIAPGCDADLLLLDAQLELVQTYCRGRAKRGTMAH